MQIEKEYSLAGNQKEVQNLLMNLEYYGELHPLIKSVESLEDASKEYEEYLIRERPFAWIPFTVQYWAQVKLDKATIEYKIIGLPFTTARIRYNWSPIAEKETEVIFKLQIEGPWIVEKLLGYKMVDAQDQLMKSINQEWRKL